MFLVSLLRLLHIVSAVLWMGIGFTMVVFIQPAIQNESGFRFMKTLYAKTRINTAYPVTAVLTTLCGILLYLSGSMNRFSQTGNIVLGIGALAGLLAFGHGAAALGPLTSKLSAQLAAALPEGSTATADSLAMLEMSLAKYQRQARVALVLTLIALVGMGLARYL